MMKMLVIFPLLFMLTAGSARAHDLVESPGACERCGMNRTAYAYSRMLIVFADGSQIGTCSLGCAANVLKEQRGKKVKSLLVADYDSRKLIDAKKAIWVIGGSKPGVMTATPEWAFAANEGASRFIAANGGKRATFDEALAIEQAD